MPPVFDNIVMSGIPFQLASPPGSSQRAAYTPPSQAQQQRPWERHRSRGVPWLRTDKPHYQRVRPGLLPGVTLVVLHNAICWPFSKVATVRFFSARTCLCARTRVCLCGCRVCAIFFRWSHVALAMVAFIFHRRLAGLPL